MSFEDHSASHRHDAPPTRPSQKIKKSFQACPTARQPFPFSPPITPTRTTSSSVHIQVSNQPNPVRRHSEDSITLYTSDMLDYNTVYGMPLPRRVVSTSASRTLGIDNIPVHEIRLIQVLQDSSYDWCLRQIAAGKNCYLEMFRSRQEAFFSTALHRHLRDSKIDFSQVLQAVAASNNMPCDLTVWENRKMASAKLTQVVGDYMISMVGSNVTEHLTERLRVLETENAQLRASQVNPSQHDGTDFQPDADINTEAPTPDESGTLTPCRTTSSQMNRPNFPFLHLHHPPNHSRTPNGSSNSAPRHRHQPNKWRTCESDPHSKFWSEKDPTTIRFNPSMRG